MSKSGFAPGADLSCAEDPYWATATAAAKHKTNRSQNARRMVPPRLEFGPANFHDAISWILCSVGTQCKGVHRGSMAGNGRREIPFDRCANVSRQTEEHAVSCQLRREVNS